MRSSAPDVGELEPGGVQPWPLDFSLAAAVAVPVVDCDRTGLVLLKLVVEQRTLDLHAAMDTSVAQPWHCRQRGCGRCTARVVRTSMLMAMYSLSSTEPEPSSSYILKILSSCQTCVQTHHHDHMILMKIYSMASNVSQVLDPDDHCTLEKIGREGTRWRRQGKGEQEARRDRRREGTENRREHSRAALPGRV